MVRLAHYVIELASFHKCQEPGRQQCLGARECQLSKAQRFEHYPAYLQRLDVNLLHLFTNVCASRVCGVQPVSRVGRRPTSEKLKKCGDGGGCERGWRCEKSWACGHECCSSGKCAIWMGRLRGVIVSSRQCTQVSEFSEYGGGCGEWLPVVYLSVRGFSKSKYFTLVVLVFLVITKILGNVTE